LSPGKREELFPQIKEKALFYEVKFISPSDIDESNLNQIDLQEIISFVAKLNPNKVIFDVPTNPSGVENFVKAVRLGLAESVDSLLKSVQGKTSEVGSTETSEVGELGRERSNQPELIGENKADENYPIVSAASVLAKVARDQVIEELHKQYGDFGSGYMSDEKTRVFLRDCFAKNGDFPPIIRRKWSSVQGFLQKQRKLI
ncbi:MAG: hypothetical protein ACOC4Z_02345, partial [Patescibacteria group bacterium]